MLNEVAKSENIPLRVSKTLAYLHKRASTLRTHLAKCKRIAEVDEILSRLEKVLKWSTDSHELFCVEMKGVEDIQNENKEGETSKLTFTSFFFLLPFNFGGVVSTPPI